jgi:hypothetical protein
MVQDNHKGSTGYNLGPKSGTSRFEKTARSTQVMKFI